MNKAQRRQRIKYRISKKLSGTTQRPRITVFRSNKFIYAQIIDDIKGHTLVSASSSEKTFSSNPMTKVEASKKVGQMLAERALAAGLKEVVFDRSGYLYHGRIQGVAEGAREGGLNF